MVSIRNCSESDAEVNIGILTRLGQGDIAGEDVIQDIRIISDAVNDAMDGTSGALYSYVKYNTQFAC